MKIVIFVALLCALQSTLISARTFDDITKDFSKYISDFHTTLGKESSFLVDAEDGIALMAEYDRNTFLTTVTYDRKLSWIYETIRYTVERIIKETGMSDHPDLIEHCQDTRNSDFNKLLELAAANKNVCMQIGEIGKVELQAILKEIADRQNPTHSKLSALISECTASSATNSQLVSCLVENLYGKIAPEMAQLMKRMRDDVAGMSATATQKLNATQTCIAVTNDQAEGRMNDIINGFRNCCVAASSGTQ